VLVDIAELQAARDRAAADATATDPAARFAAVRRALERLREPGSPAGLLAIAPAEVCRCGFDRAVLSRVTGAGWRVSAVHAAQDDSGQARRLLAVAGGGTQPLGHTARESEAVRRRVALVVRGSSRGGASVMGALGAWSYVVAPVVADGVVIGLLHADCTASGREADEMDRDVLAILAEGLGGAVHRLGLGRRLQELDDVVQRAAGSARAALRSSLALELDRAASAQEGPGPVSGSGPRPDALLTPREHEVVALMADGETNRQIAARLVVSEATVKSHVKSILRKLRATNRADAVGRYLRLQQLQG
jgi:DNA-binding CsgD family transcriptional regulator